MNVVSLKENRLKIRLASRQACNMEKQLSRSVETQARTKAEDPLPSDFQHSSLLVMFPGEPWKALKGAIGKSEHELALLADSITSDLANQAKYALDTAPQDQWKRPSSASSSPSKAVTDVCDGLLLPFFRLLPSLHYTVRVHLANWGFAVVLEELLRQVWKRGGGCKVSGGAQLRRDIRAWLQAAGIESDGEERGGGCGSELNPTILRAKEVARVLERVSEGEGEDGHSWLPDAQKWRSLRQ